MYPSAELCRTQQALQLERAAAATLANVRSIAENAAAAWATEARAADDRERRYANRLRMREALDQSQLLLSENPDRGLTD